MTPHPEFHPVEASPMRRRPVRGFTLIELLTVIAIIGILAAIIIPVVGRVRDSARGAQCVSNLRQVGIAMNLYADDHRGRFPTVYPDGNKTWRWKLVPYANMPENSMGLSPLPGEAGIFVCPAFVDKDPAAPRASSYVINAKMSDLQPYWRYDRSKVQATRTLMVVEFDQNTEYFIQWDGGMAARGLAMRHSGKTSTNGLFVDGHVAPLKETPGVSDPLWYTPN